MLERLLPQTGTCKKLQDNNQFINRYIKTVDDKAMGVASSVLGPFLDSKREPLFFTGYGLILAGAAMYGACELTARMAEASIRGCSYLAKRGIDSFQQMPNWQKAGTALLAATVLMVGSCSGQNETYQLSKEVPAFNQCAKYEK
jgi:hypothetical protein